MSRYLFSVSIGPVQEFIAAARKTRDLWFGSEILSEVSKAAALAAKNAGADLIFPAPQNPGTELQPHSGLSVANKLLFLANSYHPADLVESLRAAVLESLRSQAARALQVAGGERLSVNQEFFDRQIEAFPEFYAAWVACPEGSDYKQCRERVEKLLAARKSLRNFAQHQGSSEHKNTIDGVREDVIGAAGRKNYRGYQIKATERLDAIGLLKRFGGSGPAAAFDSTHDLAAVPYARQLLKKRAENGLVAADIDAYIRLVVDLDGPNRPFLPDFGEAGVGRLLSSEKNDEREEPAELEAVRARLHREVPPRPPYYAVLLADGDRMGQALDRCPTPAAHRDLSQRLSSFATLARQRIEEDQKELFSGLGAVVYAGGDDLLALVPLDTALQAAQTVHDAFAEAKLAGPLSVSVGLVIAHAQEDLTAVIAQAHETLKHAKNVCGRDALAITLMRRSGAPFTTGGQWADALPLAHRLLLAFEKDEVPFGLGYEWRTLAERCRRADLEGPLVARWAAAVVQQKGKKAVSCLDQIIKNRVEDADSLERLASQLVLAKALHDAGARSPKEVNS